jgi:hypothetical protein
VRQDAIESLFRAFGINGTRKGSKYSASCPFAKWTHGKGTDSNPSFFVSVSAKGSMHYKCYSCGESGSMMKMLYRMRDLTGRTNIEAMEILYDPWDRYEEKIKLKPKLDYVLGGSLVGESQRIHHKQLHQGDKHGASDRPIPNPTQSGPSLYESTNASYEVSEWVSRRVKKLATEPIPDYAKQRGISASTYVRWGLGDDKKKMRLVFPIYDEVGRLIATTERYYGPDGDDCPFCGHTRWKEEGVKHHECPGCKYRFAKYLHSKGFPRRLVLGGIHLHKDGEPIVLVEGPMDAIRLYEAGVRCPVAMFGASPAVEQMQLVARKTSKLFVMGDADRAGLQMNREVIAMASRMGLDAKAIEYYDLENIQDGLIETQNVVNAMASDPDALTQEQIRKIMPNECFAY